MPPTSTRRALPITQSYRLFPDHEAVPDTISPSGKHDAEAPAPEKWFLTPFSAPARTIFRPSSATIFRAPGFHKGTVLKRSPDSRQKGDSVPHNFLHLVLQPGRDIFRDLCGSPPIEPHEFQFLQIHNALWKR